MVLHCYCCIICKCRNVSVAVPHLNVKDINRLSVFYRFLFFMVHGFGGHCVRFNELALHIASIGGVAFGHDLGV